jgi:phage tail sheath protein FI
MPEYLSPGVYVEEVSSGSKPIEGVGTSTGAFVGGAVKGPVDEAVLVTNFTQFLDTFGGFHQDHFLAYGVRAFFGQGGTRCYVVRAFRPTTAGSPLADTAQIDLQDAGANEVLRVLAASPGSWGDGLSVEVTAPAFDPDDPGNTDGKFGLVVRLQATPQATPDIVETYTRLSLKEFAPDGRPNRFHAEQVINGASSYIEVDDLSDVPTVTAPPAVVAAQSLAGGTDGQALTRTDLIGGVATAAGGATGLHAFDTVDDVNIVAIPDLMKLADADARDGTLDGLAYCEGRGDCFFVADAPSGQNPTQVREYKQAQGAFAGGNAFNSSFGALYYPWIEVSDPLTGGRLSMPPSTAVAGTYSGTDVARGVHKAAAGTEDGRLTVARGVERQVTQGEQDTLNPEGINVIRKFPAAGIVIWGARTLSADPEWKYVNVRRLFLFLEESIDEGTQWVVFEPNDEVLWKRITRNVGAFLRIQWLEGKLVGSKAEEAFFVKCDAETNPPESVDLGRVITLIGVAPSKPAEFVIFRIQQQQPGGGEG